MIKKEMEYDPVMDIFIIDGIKICGEVIESWKTADREVTATFQFKDGTVTFKKIQEYQVLDGKGGWIFRGSELECYRFIETCRNSRHFSKNTVSQFKIQPYINKLHQA